MLQLFRDDDLELDIHLPVPFRYVPEPCRHGGRIQNVRSHHFSVVVPDSLHYKHLVTFEIDDLQCVFLDGGGADLVPDRFFIRDGEFGGQRILLDLPYLPLHGTGRH